MKLVKELFAALRNHKYELTESGMFFPKAKLCFVNYFDIQKNDEPIEFFPNLVVDEYRTRALEILFGGTAKDAAYYLAPYAGNVTPTNTWTAANFATNSTEFTNYTELTRPEWVTPATATSFAISNAASKAVITVDTGAQNTVWGIGLLSASGKSATTGVLAAANKATAARTVVATDTLTLGYTMSLQDAT